MQQEKNNNNFAIVIPAYNEEATIRDVAQAALNQCEKVIVVDDGSVDKTVEELDALPITLIKHKVNKGKAASLWDGFMAAIELDVDAIITIDGDGQHSAEDIPLLLNKAKVYPKDIIIGARLADKSVIPAKRYYANKFANFWIAWAAGYPIADSQSGFRLYPKALFDNLSISTEHSFVFESEILIKAAQLGVYSHPVKIPAVYKKGARPSHFRGVHDIILITKMVWKSLHTRWFFLSGLYHSCIRPRDVTKPDVKKNNVSKA
ncbi:MAG: glycosyltransferase family 2 protein [Gammaproteobacteria bacterium]|nr:glycosyltransferase family 2 protein [Gammaproteobacteria bacterium]